MTYNQSLLSPLQDFKKRKKDLVDCMSRRIYFFLYSTMNPMAIAIIMAIPTTAMYVMRSVVVAKFEGALVAVGAGIDVAAAVATVAPVEADDG